MDDLRRLPYKMKSSSLTKLRPDYEFPDEVPVIQQKARLRKTRRPGCGYQNRRLRIIALLFGLSCVLLACAAVVTYILVDDDDDANDLDDMKTFRRHLEEKISYWNEHFIDKDENVTTPSTRLSTPEKGFIMMSIIKEMSLRSQLPFKNLSSSEYHRRLFHDSIKDLCHPNVTCALDVITMPYRTLDGSCNNFNNPHWGMAGRSEKKILRHFFEDDSECVAPDEPAQADQCGYKSHSPYCFVHYIGSPRANGVDGAPLPSPRLVSNYIHRPDPQEDRNDTSATVMVMAFGQFLDHDLMITPMTKASNGEPIQCCTDDAKRTKGPLEACAPIDIPEVDEHFPPKSCMNFSRSAASICDTCGMCQREQINGMTSFIDDSQVYGPSKTRCNELREWRKGLLKTTTPAPSHHILLPMASDTSTCSLSDQSQFCLKAGDTRVNVVPNLSSLHIMFLREHNRIAEQLAPINPSWNDELLFQESRKILIALTQHIVYDEYLPIILGDVTMVKYGLKITQAAYDDVYDISVDPRISTSFGAASFRFGHSSVPNHQKAVDVNYTLQENILVEKTFSDPNMTFSYSNGLTRWLVQENAVKTDGFLVHGVRNMLFHNNHRHNNSFDLASLNIQRGRDHGIAPYNYWRHFCRLPVLTASDFNKNGSSMGDFTADVADTFRKVYRHPDDIDLFAGAMRELRLYRAHVGPTFACLIGKEFQRLKLGDRFYYENPPKGGMPFVGFREDQLLSIKKVQLSKIVCETMNAPRIQPDVLRPANNDNNPLVGCDQLPALDLNLWKDDRVS